MSDLKLLGFTGFGSEIDIVDISLVARVTLLHECQPAIDRFVVFVLPEVVDLIPKRIERFGSVVPNRDLQVGLAFQIGSARFPAFFLRRKGKGRASDA
jgi:hypothetical protein